MAFLGRFAHAFYPAAEQQRPERRRAGKDEQPKTPAPASCMRVDFFDAKANEWHGEKESNREIGSQQN